MGSPVGSLGERVRRVLAGLLALAAVVAILEGGARVAWTLFQDLRGLRAEPETWYLFSPESGWTARPGFQGLIHGGRRAFARDGLLAADSPQAREASAVRIVFVGDSNTFGHSVDTAVTFPEVLEELIPGVASVNLSLPGYTSSQGLATLLGRGLSLEPRCVVISFNYNDRRYLPPGEPPDGPERFARMAHRHARQAVDEGAGWLYLYRGLRALARRGGGPGREPETAAGAVRLDALRPRVTPEAYRRNLEEMAAAARRSGSEVIFLLLGDNPAQTAPLDQGRALLREGRPREAIEPFKVAMGLRNAFSHLAQLHLAEALAAAGDHAAAEAAALLDEPFHSLHGGLPIAGQEEYASVMRLVAAEQGIPLVDGAAALAETPGAYTDFCHFGADGHRRIAGLLARELHRRVLLDDPVDAAGHGDAQP